MAYTELKAGNYTTVTEYSGYFNDSRTQYKLNRSSELEAEMDRVSMPSPHGSANGSCNAHAQSSRSERMVFCKVHP